jgi:hypothetical protein
MMTAINLDDQIVATSYDAATRVCSYTYEHTDGSRYTVEVPIDHLHKIGTTPATEQVRRQHLAQKILSHIQTNPPDKARDDGSE